MYDVCILGGGIIGSTTALQCARNGLRVCIIERNSALLRGSSLAGFGALTPYSDPFFIGEAALLAEKSLQMYKNDWLPFLASRTDHYVPLSKGGLLQIATSREYLEKHRQRYSSDCIPGYRPEYISHEELKHLEPQISIENVGAIQHPEPWIDLPSYMGSITQVLLDFRDKIRTKMNARAVRVEESGDAVTVDTTDGERITARHVVVATGLSYEPTEGIENFPISWVRGDGVTVRTPNNTPYFRNNIYCNLGKDHAGNERSAFISPRANGEMLLGSTYVNEGKLDAVALNGNRESIGFGAMSDISSWTVSVANALRDCHVERQWHGWRPASTDDYPIFGVTERSERVIYALAFLGLGITMSVAVSSEIAKYVRGEDFDFTSQLNPDRFADRTAKLNIV